MCQHDSARSNASLKRKLSGFQSAPNQEPTIGGSVGISAGAALCHGSSPPRSVSEPLRAVTATVLPSPTGMAPTARGRGGLLRTLQCLQYVMRCPSRSYTVPQKRHAIRGCRRRPEWLQARRATSMAGGGAGISAAVMMGKHSVYALLGYFFV